MLFRKKPIDVQAEQFWPTVKPWPEGVKATNSIGLIVGPDENPVAYFIQTLEGPMTVTQGDWIITGVKGEKYPCKPDIFALTYEEPDLAFVDTNKLFRMLDKVAFSVSLNMNDTFGWACAESEEVAIIDLPKLLDVWEKFGSSGVDAFAAVQRDEDVMDHKAVRTPLYYAAKEYLKNYEFHGDEYMMRKWKEDHPEEVAARKAKWAAEEAEEKRKRGTKWARIKAVLFEK